MTHSFVWHFTVHFILMSLYFLYCAIGHGQVRLSERCTFSTIKYRLGHPDYVQIQDCL